MISDSDLAAELEAFQQRWEQLTDLPESPRSLMEVIEYSLDSQKKAEVYVNRLLKYLLDPEEPHGLDDDLLRAVLEQLPASCEFQEDIHDLSDIHVDDQVQVQQRVDDETVSTGYVDLWVEVPNEWFVLIELKFGAADTQTEFYYQDVTHFDGEQKSEYESGQYYVYLRPTDRSTANEPQFSNWTWAELREDVLEPLLVEHGPRYPQRTVTQIRELIDDIQNLTNMTEQQQQQQEKVELFIDHYEAIKDVSDTFDKRWETFTDEWGIHLGETLDRDGYGSYSQLEEDVVAVELDTKQENFRSWRFRTASSDWGMIFKDGWWRHTDDFRTLNGRPDDRNDVRIGFHHRLGRNRDLAIRDNTLKVYFRNMGANDQEFIDTFDSNFSARKATLRDYLPPSAEITGNKRNMIEATYEIAPDEHGDFFEAYIEVLHQSVVEFLVESEPLAEELDKLYRQSVQEVYETSI